MLERYFTLVVGQQPTADIHVGAEIIGRAHPAAAAEQHHQNLAAHLAAGIDAEVEAQPAQPTQEAEQRDPRIICERQLVSPAGPRKNKTVRTRDPRIPAEQFRVPGLEEQVNFRCGEFVLQRRQHDRQQGGVAKTEGFQNQNAPDVAGAAQIQTPRERQEQNFQYTGDEDLRR